MQMVGNIRKYKGMEPNPPAGPEKSIQKLDDWNDVTPVYTDYSGDTQPRNHPSAVSVPAITYTNTTGRNDFHLLKVARDRKNIWFYAETTGAITENSGSNWMRLLLDLDRNAKTGWLGYDYQVLGGNKLQKYVNGKWFDIQMVNYTVAENKLMITIPLKQLNGAGHKLDFEFKWSDNMQNENDPLDWYLNGDVAPGGRFNYIYYQ